jgi:cell division protein FtsW (lipid II flippase)
MSYDEKNTWIYGTVTIVSFAIYVIVILGRADGGPLVDVAYIRPMLWCIGGAILACIVGSMVVMAAKPDEADKRDERDREINRFGEFVGQSFAGVGGVLALILAMSEAEYFWIANAVYVSFVCSALLATVTKVIGYRRGFQPR